MIAGLHTSSLGLTLAREADQSRSTVGGVRGPGDQTLVLVLVILVGAVASSLGGRVAVRCSQVAAVAALVVIAAMAGVWGQLIYGSVWGFPLADVVWSFDVAMLAAEFVAFVLAIILATPGCEVGIWADLIGRMRGKGSAGFSAPSCIVGLHLLDEWEARHKVRLTKPSA